MTEKCCSEAGCRRTKPFIIYRGGLSGRVYLATDWTNLGNGTIEAKRRHDITTLMDEFIDRERVTGRLPVGLPQEIAVEELLTTVDLLWGTMTPDQVADLREAMPEVLERCQRIHEKVWHGASFEQKMMGVRPGGLSDRTEGDVK